MERHDLEIYLHEQIPLSAAMGVSVRSVTSDAVTLSAPLAPNINHKSTVFGGSASALNLLAFGPFPMRAQIVRGYVDAHAVSWSKSSV